MIRWVGLALLVAVGASSTVFVDSGDVAVVYRFGQVDRTLTAGLGLRAPWPIESHEMDIVPPKPIVAIGANRSSQM